MKITICGSMKFSKEMLEIKEKLIQMGHDVVTPPKTELYTEKESLKDDIQFLTQNDIMRCHFKLIEDSEAIIVLNYNKNGINGYIGGGALIDMGIAHFLNKKIFLLNYVPNSNELPYHVEITAMQPTILNGDLNKIKEVSG